MRMFALVLAGMLSLAAPAFAQDGKQSLADIKGELTTLSGQIEQLRNELVRTGASGGLPTQAASASVIASAKAPIASVSFARMAFSYAPKGPL